MARMAHTAALLLIVLAVPTLAIREKRARRDDIRERLPTIESEEDLCTIISLESESVHRNKTCTECSIHCLTMAECEYMAWGDMEPTPQAHLANTTCPGVTSGQYGEELCVLLAEDGEFVLDASPKQCEDCVKSCRSREECTTMAWKYESVDASDIDAYPCPALIEREQEEEVAVVAEEEMVSELIKEGNKKGPKNARRRAKKVQA